ncbi:MAG TPA: Gfo/Idh/MocA family oxidoreductase, partial [Candidatus Hydrogenedentes bacterium]|nr:Gfo/Idh/MocA family oxidoreductase [Candidatus Hydrogenedentota bacterium]
MDPVNVGVIGCGNISDLYFEAGKRFDDIQIVACADLAAERARAKAQAHGVPKACSVDALLADEEVEIVLNLTVPAAHFDVSRRALEAGRHVYSEKPLALAREEGRALLELAEKR